MEFHKTLVNAIKYWVNEELNAVKEQIKSSFPVGGAVNATVDGETLVIEENSAAIIEGETLIL